MLRIAVVFSAPVAPSIHWGSLLHGMLMERLSPACQEVLHNGEVHPFSQWVEITKKDQFVWHVQAMDDELAKEMETVFSEKNVWRCKHLGCDFTPEGIQKQSLSLAEYMKPYFLAEQAPAGLTVAFRTPCTHKVQGRYALFPSVELIGNSLRNHLCAISPSIALADDEVMDQVLRFTRISRYELRSSVFHLEWAYVTGYTGRLELHFDGPDALRRLSGVLFGIADWSGIGIKTALGMGGCTVKLLDRKGKNNE